MNETLLIKTIMKKQFVTYEIAQKLKELSFKEECLADYFVFGDGKARNGKFGQTDPELFIASINDEGLSIEEKSENLEMFAYHVVRVPLWQQAIDWLREEHKIIIDISKIGDDTDDWHYAFNHVWSYTRGTYYEARQFAVENAIELLKSFLKTSN